MSDGSVAAPAAAVKHCGPLRHEKKSIARFPVAATFVAVKHCVTLLLPKNVSLGSLHPRGKEFRYIHDLLKLTTVVMATRSLRTYVYSLRKKEYNQGNPLKPELCCVNNAPGTG